MKKTYNEILEILKQVAELSDFAYDQVGYEEFGLGEVKEVNKTGGMDKGSNWSSTKHFIDHDVYIQVKGYYSSYVGTEFGDWDDSVFEVFPKQVTKIVFEKI